MNFHRFQQGKATLPAIVSLIIVLTIAWLLWSGIYKPIIFGLGVFSVAITAYLAVRMNFFEHTGGLQHMALRLPLYWAWLLKEIIKSSIEVARIVLSPSLPIKPQVVQITSEKDKELPQVILGNSITLSPGTITIDIDGSEILVHCINDATADDLKSGELMKRVDQLEQ